MNLDRVKRSKVAFDTSRPTTVRDSVVVKRRFAAMAYEQTTPIASSSCR